MNKARQVRSLGARRPFILGTEGLGTGELPEPKEAEWLALGVPAVTIMDAIRAGRGLLADLPKQARVALDRYDPDGSALVLGSFLHDLPAVAGRSCLAYRRAEWVALEDKVVIDGFWDRAGVPRAPTKTVPAALPALREAAARLDRGQGTVWVGDARDGFHGGGEYARWVRRGAEAGAAAAFLAAHCDRARVMPFLEGIPCSIHGLVAADDLAVFRPVELIVLRRPDAPELFYAGAASYWDPAPEDREWMRDVARRVGHRLRHEVSFRGPFTVDGVMTEDGFRPTELNPRSGAGLQTLTRGLPDVPLELINDAIAAGVDLDYRLQALESLIVEAADAHRAGGTWRAVTTPIASEFTFTPVASDATGYHWARDDEPAEAWLTGGASGLGGFVRLTLNAQRTPKGPSIAPQAVAFYRFADRQLATNIGALEPAVAVR